jgi:hypothetical protein
VKDTTALSIYLIDQAVHYPNGMGSDGNYLSVYDQYLKYDYPYYEYPTVNGPY